VTPQAPDPRGGRRPGPEAHADPPGAGVFRAGAPAILGLACLAAFWNSFRAELLLDDQTILLKAPRLTAAAWQNVRDIFVHQYW
jgi:hypothetical protein